VQNHLQNHANVNAPPERCVGARILEIPIELEIHYTTDVYSIGHAGFKKVV
jgi:hypothetical protein